MNTIEKLAKEFEEQTKASYKDEVSSFYKTQYVTIVDGGETRISPYTYYMEDADICMVICKYSYIVISASDTSCFVQFVDKNGWSKDHYKMGDWILSFEDEPLTSSFRTYNCRFCRISNGVIGVRIDVRVSDICEQLKLLWAYFLKMQECTTQKELDLLKLCFTKDVAILDLTESNRKSAYDQAVADSTMDAYKAVLDKIQEIVRGQ